MLKKILSTILIFLILLLVILLYSRFIGTKGLKTNEIIYKTNIEESYNGLKIIHFSDIHYKKVIEDKQIKNLITKINNTKPDIVLFTGDLLDKDYSISNKEVNFLIKEFSKIEATYGVYAILGDNDVEQLDIINNIYIQSNITLLKNEGKIIYNENNDKIFIGGLAPYLTKEADINKTMEYLNNFDNISFKIILTHEPDYINEILDKYSNIPLILSSHSINGSINIPIIKKVFLPNGAKQFYNPYYKINDTSIYISNGIGVNNINFRLFNTPSINLYRITKSNE